MTRIKHTGKALVVDALSDMTWNIQEICENNEFVLSYKAFVEQL